MSAVLVVVATFLAAGVEWVEALTIVLAVGLAKSWRTALLAAVAALAVLLVLVTVFGLALTAYVSIASARTAVGIGLLLIGLGWLYKAILRSAGLKALRNEATEFAEAQEHLMTHGHAFGTAFGGVFLEGFEVVFIVVALGGLNSVTAATVGALSSLVVVCGAGIALRHPLTRVPENVVKYAVGIMLTSFGTFFAGEGLGVAWLGGDLAILGLIAAYTIASIILVRLLVWRPTTIIDSLPARVLRAAVIEVWGLFVTNGVLAAAAVITLLAVFISFQMRAGTTVGAGVLVGGVIISLVLSLWAEARSAVVRARTPAERQASAPPVAEAKAS